MLLLILVFWLFSLVVSGWVFFRMFCSGWCEFCNSFVRFVVVDVSGEMVFVIGFWFLVRLLISCCSWLILVENCVFFVLMVVSIVLRLVIILLISWLCVFSVVEKVLVLVSMFVNGLFWFCSNLMIVLVMVLILLVLKFFSIGCSLFSNVLRFSVGWVWVMLMVLFGGSLCSLFGFDVIFRNWLFIRFLYWIIVCVDVYSV